MEGKSIKKIGNYYITSNIIGKGTFSTVYLAYDNQQTAIAAKVISLKNVKGKYHPI
jgi:serine/threonine protein kinase